MRRRDGHAVAAPSDDGQKYRWPCQGHRVLTTGPSPVQPSSSCFVPHGPYYKAFALILQRGVCHSFAIRHLSLSRILTFSPSLLRLFSFCLVTRVAFLYRSVWIPEIETAQPKPFWRVYCTLFAKIANAIAFLEEGERGEFFLFMKILSFIALSLFCSNTCYISFIVAMRHKHAVFFSFSLSYAGQVLLKKVISTV